MDIAEIRKLVRVMRDHGISELEIQDRRGRVRLVREDGRAAAVIAAVPPPAVARPTDGAVDGAHTVVAPMVGRFYRGPGPDAPPFVDVGTMVERGQVLGVVEAMKMLNEIVAEVRGRVLRILAEDGGAVEYGAPLFVLEPV
jgi:acetyl-CoA carboxylase biotin carboxyl carrier protein